LIDFEARPDERRSAAASMSRRALHISVLSACGLVVELVLIRWLDAQVRPLAYVKNLVLIASFLGLGIGYATPFREKPLVKYGNLLLALVLGVAVFLGSSAGKRFQIGPGGPESNIGTAAADSPVQVAVFYGIVAAVFALVVIALVPIGQLTAETMHGASTLPAYTANLAGSLAGVLAVFALSAIGAPPWITVMAAMLILAAYLWRTRAWAVVSAAATILTAMSMIAADHRPESVTIWSPYNRIELAPLPRYQLPGGRIYVPGWQLSVQNLYYQRILDLSNRTVARFPDLPGVRHLQEEYNYPYFWKKPHQVLVLGAGTGNDVAAALRNGAEHVDAVDIDPQIVTIGQRLHPEQPYRSPRVRLLIDDARAYLARSPKRYDMIVFGILDAHTSFYSSLAGGIRLDNYVYTSDAFRQALARLTPDGILVISFYFEHPWLVTRLAAMLQEANGGRPPYTLQLAPTLYSFVAGPGVPPQPRFGSQTGSPDAFRRTAPALQLSTDDWPFLYLRDRLVPPTILWAGAAILLISMLMVVTFFRGELAFDRHFFFLGAGFLLVETRTIAQLALLFGTTWRVSAVAIAAILTVAMAANLVIEKRGPMPRLPLYLLLGAALVLNFAVPVSAAVGAGLGGRVGMAFLLALPVAFSSLIFASAAAEERALAPVLASNLVGAVLGGLLENVSLFVGISALSLVAIAVYAASFRRGRSVAI
jgi:SAM-dependent methyltransferase